MNATMIVSRNPLVPASAVDVRPARMGVALAELAPITSDPLMLRLNGEWLLRADWQRPALPGDVIEWHIVPQGGGGGTSRILLTIALVVASIAFGGALGAFLAPGVSPATAAAIGSAVINIAGAVLINALVPVTQPQLGGGAVSPGSVYNVALAANQARINQPIPEIFGRCLTFPDFAGQPYSEFDSNNDQYYNALFCIGQGEYNVERIQIDDTALSSFQDVIASTVLPPGVLPSVVLGNVVSAPEVVGQDLLSGVYVGAFAASSPRYVAGSIGIDIVLPRGLALASTSGSLGTLTARFRVDAQYIDDFGVAISAWFPLGPTETISAATSAPVRRSFRYTLATPGRVQVRVGRQDVRNANARALHDMSWAGLRAYLSAPVLLEPTATHLEIRIRASEQLSGFSQRKISVVVRRKLRTWSTAGGWSAPVETRNAAWALAHLWTNANGEGQSDETIDLTGLERLAATLDARQDRLDLVFDGRVTAREAARQIGQSCRSMPFSRMTVSTVARDERQTLPVTAFTSRSMIPGSMSIGYALPTEMLADGVIVEYFDNRSWDWRDVLCPAPGVVTPQNAVRVRLVGVTGPKHAEREGLYQAAQNVYRRKFPKFQTEMLGMLPAYGSLAIFAPALPGWGQAGDAVDWDEATLTLGLSEPVEFTAGAVHYISLQRDDGSMTDAIEAGPGPTASDVVLASIPDFEMTLDLADRERTKFVFGAEGQHRVMVRVLGITKRGGSGAPMVELSTVAENDLVHTVDNHLLPGPGEIQDPVDSSSIPVADGGSGAGSFAIVSLNSHGIFGVGGAPTSVSFTLNNTGQAVESAGYWPTAYAEEWTGAPIDPLMAAGFEVRAVPLYGGADLIIGSALSVWLNLGTTRTWSLESTTQVQIDLQVTIREVGASVPQAQATITLGIADPIEAGAP